MLKTLGIYFESYSLDMLAVDGKLKLKLVNLDSFFMINEGSVILRNQMFDINKL
jgi:hypothetical protein